MRQNWTVLSCERKLDVFHEINSFGLFERSKSCDIGVNDGIPDFSELYEIFFCTSCNMHV